MNEFTEKEKEALIKFRKRLEDLNLQGDDAEDWFLIKWLRARDLSISKAESMFRESLEWRKKYKIDEIVENWTAPEVFSQIFPMELCGYSKQGCPVIVCPAKFFDINEFWAKCDADDHMLYGSQNMERLKRLMKEKSTKDHPVTEAIAIHDLEGFNIRSVMNRAYMERMQRVSTSFTDNYPEFIHKAYFVNAPKLFSILFTFFKHILPKKTLEKFEIHGYDKETWVARLLEHIDPEVLPPAYGGTNYEFEKKAFAGLIPTQEKYAAAGGAGGHRNSIQDHLCVKVSAGRKHSIDFRVEKPGAILSWSFKTEENDISFGVFFYSDEKKDEEEVSLVPNARVDSANRKQVGRIVCENPGKYSIVFDNTYSRLRSKAVHYHVELKEEGGDGPLKSVQEEKAEEEEMKELVNQASTNQINGNCSSNGGVL